MTSRRLPLRPHLRRVKITKRTNRRPFKVLHFQSLSLKKVCGLLTVVIFLTFLFIVWRLLSLSVWDGKDRVTLAITSLDNEEGGEVYLVSYLPSGELAVVSLPASLQVETIGGFGQWKVESLYSFGELENKGGALLSGTLSDFFGVRINGWIACPQELRVFEDTVRADLRRLFFRLALGKGRTNLGLWDLIRLWFFLGSVRLSGVEIVDLATTGVLREAVLPDGTLTYRTDPERLDQLLRMLFASDQVTKERLAIAVLNATFHSRLANKAARLVQNVGGDVVSISDFPKSQEKSQIVLSDNSLRSTQTVSEISELFLIQDITIGETENRRAEILLIVGEDYWQRLMEL